MRIDLPVRARQSPVGRRRAANHYDAPSKDPMPETRKMNLNDAIRRINAETSGPLELTVIQCPPDKDLTESAEQLAAETDLTLTAYLVEDAPEPVICEPALEKLTRRQPAAEVHDAVRRYPLVRELILSAGESQPDLSALYVSRYYLPHLRRFVSTVVGVTDTTSLGLEESDNDPPPASRNGSPGGETARRCREIVLLGELARHLRRSHTAEGLYEALRANMDQLLPGRPGALWILSEDRECFEAAAAWGDSPGCEVESPPSKCMVLRARSRESPAPSEAPDQSAPPAVCCHRDDPLHCCLCAIVETEAGTRGVLHVTGVNTADRERTQTLAAAVALQVGLSLNNIEIQQNMRGQDFLDPLTGAFNRRYLDVALVREIHQAERGGYPLGIVMLDLDSLKHVNDRLESDGGDQLIQRLANHLKAHVRAGDILCRYGADEFALLLPSACLENSYTRAESLRHPANDALRALVPQKFRSRLALSIGVAAYPECGADGPLVLQAAERALAQAKTGSRSRVERADLTQESA